MWRNHKTLTLLVALAMMAGNLALAQDITFTPINQIDSSRIGEMFYADGVIAEHKTPWNDRAPHIVTLRDATGTVDVVFWTNVYDTIEGKERLTQGTQIWVYGELDEYRGNLQLRLGQASHLKIGDNAAMAPGGSMPAPGGVAMGAPAPAMGGGNGPRPIAIGDISMNLMGQQVIVRGMALQIIDPPNDRTPTRITLEDDTGVITVVYWVDVSDNLYGANKPQRDGVYEIAGEVGEHRGNLQLRVSDPSAVRAVTLGGSSAAASSPPPTMPPPPGAGMASNNPPPPGAGAPFGSTPPPPSSGGSTEVGQYQNVNPFDSSSANATPTLIAEAPSTATPASSGATPFDSGTPWGGASAAGSPPPASPTPVPASPFISGNSAPLGASSPAGTTTPPPPSVARGSSQPFGNAAPPSLGSSAPMTAAPALPAGTVAIGGLNANSNGMVVTIDAKVDRVTKTAGSVLLRVSDSTGRTSVFLSSTVLDEAGADKVASLKRGARVRLEGEVRLYNEKPELHVREGAGLKSVTPAQ